MANDTKLTINIETVLRGLEKTLRGLSQVEKSLKTVSTLKVNVANTDKAALASLRLATQAQRLANEQAKAKLTADRLALSQLKLEQAFGRAASAATKSASAQQRAAKQAAAEQERASKRIIAAQERAQRQATVAAARQARAAQVAARAREREAKAALRAAPDLDAHVQDFRRLEDARKKAFQGLDDAARQSNQRLSALGNSLRSLGQGMASLGAALTIGLTVPLVAFGTAATDAAVRVDSLTRGLTAIVGDADKANKQLAELTEIAKLPGIGFEEAIQGSIRLQAVGFSAAGAEKALIQFSNAVALTGGGRDELARITVQLGQLAAKGKVLSQDLRPIIEAAPAVGRALKEAFGTVNADDIAELTTNSKQFLDTLISQLEKLERAPAGARNAFENFRDEVFRASAAVGKSLIPILLSLVNTVGPLITKLADGFGKLPTFVQALIVVTGTLAAAAGPVLFIMGQFVTGIGRVIVSLVQLRVLGILPTITSFRLLGQVMVGTVSLIQGAEATAAASRLGWTALGVAIAATAAVIAAVVVAYKSYSSAQEKAGKTTEEQVQATQSQIESLQNQLAFLDSLSTSVLSVGEEQDKLRQVYAALNKEAQVRVEGTESETERLGQLRAEIDRLLKLRKAEQVIQAQALAGAIANNQAQIQANEQRIQSITDQIIANSRLSESLQETGKITNEQSVALAKLGINSGNAQEAVGLLASANENLLIELQSLREETNKTRDSLKGQSEILKILEERTGLTVRQILAGSKAMGVFKGDVEQAAQAVDEFRRSQESAVPATDTLTDSITRQANAYKLLGEAAEKSGKTAKEGVEGLIKALANSGATLEEARVALDAHLKQFPELRKQLDKLLAGRKIEDVLLRSVGLKDDTQAQDKSADRVRNAQEKLAQALADIALASAAKQGQIQKLQLEESQRINEDAFQQNLISLEVYLATRARLVKEEIQLEISQQQKLLDEAVKEQKRFEELATQQRKPAARVKAQADAKEAEERAIKIATKVLELQDKQKQADEERARALKEHAIQQEEDIHQLQIEYAELTNRIQESLDAATDEKFHLSLAALAKDQQTLNTQLEAATKARKADDIADIKAKIARNQQQVDLINNITREERAINALTAARERLRQAADTQADLESELSFQVRFRGLQEEEAIKRRLEGERVLAKTITDERDRIQQVIDLLQSQGFAIPQSLIDSVRELNNSLRGLGELDFSEKFRIIEARFSDLNDRLQNQIQDVERAIESRNTSEIEGRQTIRNLNEEYLRQLEEQVILLERIASESGDRALQSQARQARQRLEDIRATTTELENFNRQLRSVSIDAFSNSLSQLFQDLADNTQSAADDIKNFFRNLASQITAFVAQDFARRIAESLFPDPKKGGGIFDSIKQAIFGGGGEGKAGAVIDSAAGKAVEAAPLQAAATSLATAGVTAATSLTTGAATSAATFSTSVVTSAASFAASVVAAGAAFAASVAAGSAASAIGGAGGGLASLAGAATGDVFTPKPGGRVIRVAEAGHTEAVLTTDPKHAVKQLSILRAFLRQTRGLGGRIPSFAEGGMISPRQAEQRALSSIQRSNVHIPLRQIAAATGGGGSELKLRQVVVDDQRSARDWLTSSEGEQVLNTWLLTKGRPVIQRFRRN